MDRQLALTVNTSLEAALSVSLFGSISDFLFLEMRLSADIRNYY